MNPKRKTPFFVGLILSAIILFLLYWFQLPPLHLRSPAFWIFVIEIIATCLICFSVSGLVARLREILTAKDPAFQAPLFRFHRPEWKRFSMPLVAVLAIAAILVLMFVGSIIGAEIFNAGRYRDMITVTDGDFAQDIAQLSMDQIPVVDRDTAMRLGQRQLGTIPDLVSQFEISSDYTQINVGGKPTRVTPLVYADFFKWLGNRKAGIPGYITVDMVTQDTKLVRLPEGSGIRYSESELFMRNIHRYLRFSYPTKIFGNVLFEIHDDGTPYWVAPCMYYRIGLWNGIDVQGAVLVNAITGKSTYYDAADIPSWLDRVYDANNIIHQLNWNGQYQEGFLNAYFGQRNVRLTTDGYNYITVGDDVYMYTGMTSATADESNIGFVLVNMRTKETKFYTVPGAEEYSAMASAEGQVQHLNYTATFPLLLNVADRPTYFMSLKDASGLVKMYAYVDVQRYQIVGTGGTIEEAQADYIAKLSSDVDTDIPEETATVTGAIYRIETAVVEGSTRYYILLEGNEQVYTAPVSLSPSLPFLQEGDEVTLTYNTLSTGHTFSVTAIETEIPATEPTTTGTTAPIPDAVPAA